MPMPQRKPTPPCPNCNGPMWDERLGRYYKPGGPDYRCKDKENCGGIAMDDAPPAPQQQRHANAPGPMPQRGVPGQRGPQRVPDHPQQQYQTGGQPAEIVPAYLDLYAAIAVGMAELHRTTPALPELTVAAVQSAAAVCWAEQCRRERGE